MKKSYWDRLAASYSDDVLEITAIDTHHLLARTAASFGGDHAVAGDFGCGVGATTRTFAPYFARTIGVDFSPRLLEEAARRTRADNITYVLADLASDAPIDLEVDAGFCVNCLIATSHETRMRIARQVARCVRTGGPVAFVVPSLESVLRTYQALVRIDVGDGARHGAAVRRIDALAAREIRSLTDGIVEIGGVSTKHYLGDEIAQFLGAAGFRIDTIERVEYAWDVELELGEQARGAADVLGARTPWDWLLVGTAP